MEIRCPICAATLTLSPETAASGEASAVCPECGRTLEIESADPGLVFVAAARCDPAAPAQCAPAPDPYLEDLMGWRLGAMLAVAAGVLLGLVLGLAMARDFSKHGLDFIHRPGNLIIFSALVFACLAAVGGGGALLIVTGREKARRIKELEGRGAV